MDRERRGRGATRRTFLRSLLGVAGASALAGAGGGGVPLVRQTRPQGGGTEATGYRLTAHIRTYYEKASL